MVTQPRTEPGGRTFEYGPTYKQLHAISHGKPIVAATLAGADYHTAPNLMRLAMAEAAAHKASYLAWPTWPENQRERMIAAVRPQADFLRQHEALLNDSEFRADVIVFLPFRRWVETEHCAASDLALSLSRANIQYIVVSEDDFAATVAADRRPVLLIESLAVLSGDEKTALETFQRRGGRIVSADHGDWLRELQQAIARPSITLKAPAEVRAVVHDQPNRAIIHLYNLNVERVSSFEDKTHPATNIEVVARLPFQSIRRAKIYSADGSAPTMRPNYTTDGGGSGGQFKTVIPHLEASAILVIEADAS
jgi:hypothetical protein